MTNQLQIKILSAAFIGCVALALTGCVVVSVSQNQLNPPAQMSGGSTGYIGQTLTLGQLAPGTDPCLPNYCTYLLFNNLEKGFILPCTPVFITLKVNGVVYATADYEVRWRKSFSSSGCATTYSATQKRFVSVVNKKYTFTVYFRGTCPSPEDEVEIIIECP